MSGPERLRLKRRLGDLPPDELFVNQPPPHKRSFTDSEQLKYVRHAAVEPLDNFTTPRGPVVQSIGRAAGASRHGEARRTFHLHRTSGGKRKVRDEGTIPGEGRTAKQKAWKARPVVSSGDGYGREDVNRPLKRPGRGAAVRSEGNSNAVSMIDAPREDIQEIADDLHQFALDELTRTEKPRMTAMPRLPGARSRELHRQRTAKAQALPSPLPATTEDDRQMADDDDDEGSYVYDTYVLVPAGASTTMTDEQAAAQLTSRNVGYIVLTDDDVATWETYMEDDASDQGWDSEDEDENAERYHGADYPEDELASDDEDGTGTYGYRNLARSDDEEYDEDTGVYSEEEGGVGGELWRRKTPAEFVGHVTAREEALD